MLLPLEEGELDMDWGGRFGMRTVDEALFAAAKVGIEAGGDILDEGVVTGGVDAVVVGLSCSRM